MPVELRGVGCKPYLFSSGNITENGSFSHEHVALSWICETKAIVQINCWDAFWVC